MQVIYNNISILGRAMVTERKPCTPYICNNTVIRRASSTSFRKQRIGYPLETLILDLNILKLVFVICNTTLQQLGIYLW